MIHPTQWGIFHRKAKIKKRVPLSLQASFGHNKPSCFVLASILHTLALISLFTEAPEL